MQSSMNFSSLSGFVLLVHGVSFRDFVRYVLLGMWKSLHLPDGDTETSTSAVLPLENTLPFF
jgi:hypothetical protein